MRSKTFIAVAVVLTTLLAGVAVAYAYDHGRRDRIARGVTVGGVDVGGMRTDQARAKLQRELLSRLGRAVVVQRGNKAFHLTAREARIRGDLSAMVDSAIERSRRTWIIGRIVRDLAGSREDAALPSQIDYSDEAVTRLLSRVKRHVAKPAVNADVSYTAGAVSIKRAHNGVAVDTKKLRRDVGRMLVQPGTSTIAVRTRTTRPSVPTSQVAKRYPWIIVVDRDSFRLRLFRKLKLKKTYRIAVGQAGLETPAGLYHVQNKQIDPAWHVPKRPWAGKLAGTVVPGGIPSNPLKSRWLGIFDGAGIHGTDNLASLGTAASHGCVRMAIPDVEEVYDEVPVGAPVYVA